MCLNIAGVLYVGTLEAEGDEEMRQEGGECFGAVKGEAEAAPSGFFELLMMS